MGQHTTYNGNGGSIHGFNHLAAPVASSHHDSGTELSVRFDRGPTSAAAARNALLALDQRIDQALLDDIRLLVSELVTNAIRHADAAGGQVGLDVSINGPSVRVEVADPGDGFDPAPRTEAMTKPGGWGLYLVDRIADRWGVVKNKMTRVWFEVDLESHHRGIAA
jgi:anti-sigma regulatory factor (Ser/Thr protein kinase)